jgi:hypothetical protein
LQPIKPLAEAALGRLADKEQGRVGRNCAGSNRFNGCLTAEAVTTNGGIAAFDEGDFGRGQVVEGVDQFVYFPLQGRYIGCWILTFDKEDLINQLFKGKRSVG